MEKTKLLEWLKCLTSVEFDDFILFAESPYHNKNTAVIPLIKYLKKYHPKLSGSKVAKPLVFKKIHPARRPYKEARMNVLMSQSLRLLEDFFAYETVKHNSLTFQRQQLIAYRDRHLDKAFSKAVKRTEDLLDTQRQDQDYHFAKYQLNREIFYHPATPRYEAGMPSLEGALHHLDSFFVWEKINLATLAINRMHLVNEKYEFLLLESVQSECNSIIKDSLVLDFSHKLMLLLQTEDKNLLQELSEKFELISSQLSFEKGQTFLFLLLNFSVMLNRKSDTYLEEQIFTLYEIGLSNKYLEINGKISESLFLGIITTACQTKRFDWGSNFIDLYSDQITPEIAQENIITLGRSIFEFIKAETSEGNYTSSVKYLEAVKFTSDDYAYRVKSMLLRLFLIERLKGEQNSDFINDFALAYERQVLRDRVISPNKKDNYLQTIRIVRLMLKYHDTKSEKDLVQLTERLKSEKSIHARKWLIKKLEEMLL